MIGLYLSLFFCSLFFKFLVLIWYLFNHISIRVSFILPLSRLLLLLLPIAVFQLSLLWSFFLLCFSLINYDFDLWKLNSWNNESLLFLNLLIELFWEIIIVFIFLIPILCIHEYVSFADHMFLHSFSTGKVFCSYIIALDANHSHFYLLLEIQDHTLDIMTIMLLSYEEAMGFIHMTEVIIQAIWYLGTKQTFIFILYIRHNNCLLFDCLLSHFLDIMSFRFCMLSESLNRGKCFSTFSTLEWGSSLASHICLLIWKLF